MRIELTETYTTNEPVDLFLDPVKRVVYDLPAGLDDAPAIRNQSHVRLATVAANVDRRVLEQWAERNERLLQPVLRCYCGVGYSDGEAVGVWAQSLPDAVEAFETALTHSLPDLAKVS